MANNFPQDTRDFLGLGDGLKYDGFVRAPSFKGAGDDLVDKSSQEKQARFRASAEMLFRTDTSKLDDVGVGALYQVVTKGMFGVEDVDGSVAFGKRASTNPRHNIDLLRRFVKGEYNLIEDAEYTKWREMDEEAKFQYAREQETKGNKFRSHLKGERGTSIGEQIWAGAVAGAPSLYAFQKPDKDTQEALNDISRRTSYEHMSDEEKAQYRSDVIGDYEERLSRRQTLATYLQFSQGLSDRASYLLAKSFNDGAPDINIEGLQNKEERDKVYSAFSLMRGNQKRGRLLGITTDFTDESWANRAQLGLYGLQQSILGLVTDTASYATDLATVGWVEATKSDAERKEFYKGWDALVRAEQVMEQPLPEAESVFGEGFQGFMENVHWIIPTTAATKGGAAFKAAGKTIKHAKNMKKGGEAFVSSYQRVADAAKVRWLGDVERAAKVGGKARKINQFQSAKEYRRAVAAVDQYTKELQQIPGMIKKAGLDRAKGGAMWFAGEASSFCAFANEYLASADAAGISREDSVLTASMIGLINSRIERMYVYGLESTLTPSQIKGLTYQALFNAVRSDGAKGFRSWFANRIAKDVPQMGRVLATEGLIEEPLQQLATEHGKAFDELCGKLRAEGKEDEANKAIVFWNSFKNQLPNDYAIFIDTVCDVIPTSLAFAGTSVGNMKIRQHVHNVAQRHANRRMKSTSTMLTARSMEELTSATDYDIGVVDMIQRGINTRLAMEKHWSEGNKKKVAPKAGTEENAQVREGASEDGANPNRFIEAITAARRAYANPQTGDVVSEIAEVAGVDVKTGEVLMQYLQTEAEMTAFSPQARAFRDVNMSMVDINEESIKTILPGYVDGSYAADEEAGTYSGRVKLGDGTERTIVYKIGNISSEVISDVNRHAELGSSFGKSFNARQKRAGTGIIWESLSDSQRYMEALQSALTVNGMQSGKRGVFELKDSKGETVRVNADDIIYLANGRLGDIGYGSAASMGTARHETWHALWSFARASMEEADVQHLAKTLGVDVTQDGWEVELDEEMAHQLESYASGHYVAHTVSSRFDKMVDGWAGKLIQFFGKFGPTDEVRDPTTGKSFALKDFYDGVLRGRLGSGDLGVELRKIKAEAASPASENKPTAEGTIPVDVTEEEIAQEESEVRASSSVEENSLPDEEGSESTAQTPNAPTESQESKPQANVAASEEYTSENPADASVANARYYRIGLPNSEVKLVGRLEVRDVDTGVITSTDENYHDRGNQNRDDQNEESRSLVQKIAANPDPLQVGTVQPVANNGIVWALPNGDIIIGNHRVNGVRAGYEKGTAGDLEKFVREDAAKRGIEIGEHVKKPLTVFVLERIETPDGMKTADVHEVVRLANESQNRGFNIREQAGNDAKILLDHQLIGRMAFRADGRIDETKSSEAIGIFRRESGAQGIVGEDGMLSEEGQTRIQNAALAALLGGTGNSAVLAKIMEKSGRLDMGSQVRALMKMTPDLMSLAQTESKSAFDLRGPLAEALELFTEWREKDELERVEKGKSRNAWRELDKDGKRIRGLSWQTFMSQGDMFRTPSKESLILADLLAHTESLRSFNKEDVESDAGKKRVVDLISEYLADYIRNAYAVNTETEDMFGEAPASRADVLTTQRAKDGALARFSIVTLGGYMTDDLRSLAHRVKSGDGDAIADAGRRLAAVLPKDAVLVPMPSHTGEPTTMKLLADAIAENVDGASVIEALRSNPHESNYEVKKRGDTVGEIEMSRVAEIPGGREVYIVDNVVDTGSTYRGAMRAIPNAHIVALADTDRTPEELRRTFSQNIDYILSGLDEAKGLSKKEIFAKFDNTNLEIGWLPGDLRLPEELSVAKRVVKAAQAYVLDHLHNKPEHEQQLTADDARRMLSLINPNNEMRIIPQRDSSSLAFIAENPSGGWDCIVIAPRRGEFYIFKTMFAQKRKPYQDKSLIRYSVGLAERGNAVGSLIRGLLTSVRDIDQTQHNVSQNGDAVNGQARFSINPNLRADVEAALNTDRNSGKVEKGELRVNFCDAPPLFTAIGLSTGKIYSKAYILRKIAKEHNLSSEQIASAPKLLESPAVVFDDHGKGYIFLTETVAMDEDGQLAPVMFYLREDAEGNFIASAYARKEKAESKYVNLVNAGKVLYFDKNKVTRLPLRGEAQSSLNTFNAGDKVATQNWTTVDNLSQNGDAVNGQSRFSMAAPVERRKDLIAFHNVSAAGLKGMDELGGLAVPSFAITKDTIGGDEFGEISLLVRPETIDPKRRGNKIFTNDAWTPTFPETKLKTDGKVVDRIQERISKIFWDKKNIELRKIATWSADIDSGNITDHVNRHDGDAISALGSLDTFKIAYLVETGKEPHELPTKEAKLFHSSRGTFSPQGIMAWVDNKTIAALSESLSERLLENGGEISWDEAGKLLEDAELHKQIADIIDSASGRAEFEESPLSDELIEYPLNPIDFVDLSEAIVRYRQDGFARVLDRVATLELVNSLIDDNRNDFEAWLKELSDGITDGKRYIRNARSLYTPSGRRRNDNELYEPLTLDAAVKSMLKQKEQGAGIMGANPFGVAARKYRSLADVIADEGRLQSLTREEIKKNKEELSDRLQEIISEYNSTQKQPDENPYTQYRRAVDMMLDSYTVAKGKKAKLIQELNGWGYSASEDLVDRFIDVMKDMASMPEDYFEAKAYRAVGFDEIAAAIVPESASDETKQILEARGVAAYTYKSEDKADRLRALNEAADAANVRFSLSGDLTGAMMEKARKENAPRTPQGYSPYFQEAEGAVEIPIRVLRTLKDEPQRSIDNAARYMRKAAAGRMAKRAPVSVVDNKDGTFTVIDGNATTWAGATQLGLEYVRANIVGTNRGTRLANSQYLISNDDTGVDADGRLRNHGLNGLTGEEARERAYEQAEENIQLLTSLVESAAQKANGVAVMRPENKSGDSREVGKSIKKRVRVDEKAINDYKGDYSRVVDLIGGTIVLPDAGDLTDAIKAITENLPDGASIVRVKKLSDPDKEVYWDVKISVRFKNGGIGEIIIVNEHINDAKFNRGGHELYDFQRVLSKCKGEEITELLESLNELEKGIYSHKTKNATLYQGDAWDLAKSTASKALTRLRGNIKDLISLSVMNRLNELLSGSHLRSPASWSSYATPARSFIQNDINENPSGQTDTRARAKASASSSLTRVRGDKNFLISELDIGKLNELLSGSHLQKPASLSSQAIPARSFIQNDINTSLSETQKTVSDFGDDVNSENNDIKIKSKFSIAEPNVWKKNASGLFPSLASMSDEELITAAVAVKMALGKSEKASDKTLKITTVQKMLKRLNPDWDSVEVGKGSQRVMAEARKFAKKIRADIDRGVSDSLILEHLPAAAREQFGREMIAQTRTGQRLGTFGQKVDEAIESRQAEMIEEAVRIQSGIDVTVMENKYGISLSQTLMNLAENSLRDRNVEDDGRVEESEEAEDGTSQEDENAEERDVSEAVKEAVAEIVAASGDAARANELNREERRNAAKREEELNRQESQDETTEEEENTSESGLEEEDLVAVITKKAGINLENPRHLAEFITEFARRHWIEEHSLPKDANVWRDLVAVQFLRKTSQSIYAKLCHDLTYSRSRETAMSHIMKLDSVPTVQGLLSQMEFVGALINAQRIWETQKSLCKKLESFLVKNFGAKGRFKPDKEEGKRKVSAEAELRARYMRKAMWMTPNAVADESAELQEKLDTLSVEFGEAGRDVDQSREQVDTIRKLNILREFGGLRYKSVGEIDTAVEWWKEFEKGASEGIIEEMNKREIRTKKAAKLLAAAFANPSRTTLFDDSQNRFNNYLRSHMGFVALLNDCMRYSSQKDRAAAQKIVNYLALEIQKAGDAVSAEKRQHKDAFHAAVESIYGRSFNKVMKEMMQTDERFLEFMGETAGVKDSPTKGRAMQLLVSLLQEGRKIEITNEDGTKSFIYENGYGKNIEMNGRKGQAEAIMKLLTPADINMIKWMGMWYEQNRQDLSDVCHSLFGIGVYAELPNYFPVKMKLDKQGLEKGMGVGWSIFPKALTPRVRNQRDFDTSADIFQMWSARMEEGAQWKHHAKLGLEIRGIFGRAELQSAVIAHHGNQANDMMQGFITDVLTGKGAIDRSLNGAELVSDKVRGWVALCALAGNVGVMLKQTTSMPAFGFEIGLVDTAKYIINAWSPEGFAAMRKLIDSDQRKTRWDVGYSEAVANALRNENAGALKRMLQAAMITNKLGDIVPGLIVGQGIYRDCLARGMSEVDAMAQTWMIIERTQQSSRMENLASMQRRNKLGRAMFQFMSTQRQYLDYEIRAIRDLIAQPGDVERWKKFGGMMVLNHFILTSLYYWMGQLYKAMLGQEPPEDELTDWVVSCLLGPFGSLFVLGFCCKYTLERAFDGKSFRRGSTMLPMESWLANQISDGAGLVEAIFSTEGDTFDNILDATARWMSDFNSTFRDLRKIYRFRIEEEDQKRKKK